MRRLSRIISERAEFIAKRDQYGSRDLRRQYWDARIKELDCEAEQQKETQEKPRARLP